MKKILIIIALFTSLVGSAQMRFDVNLKTLDKMFPECHFHYEFIDNSFYIIGEDEAAGQFFYGIDNNDKTRFLVITPHTKDQYDAIVHHLYKICYFDDDQYWYIMLNGKKYKATYYSDDQHFTVARDF